MREWQNLRFAYCGIWRNIVEYCGILWNIELYDLMADFMGYSTIFRNIPQYSAIFHNIPPQYSISQSEARKPRTEDPSSNILQNIPRIL